MKNIKRVFILIGLSILATSCYYDKYQDAPVTPTEVSFATDIQPIFNSNCVACHTTGGQTPNLTASNSYSNLIAGGYIVPNDLISSVLYQKISGNIGGIMPPSGALSVANKNLVRDWILQGAQNN